MYNRSNVLQDLDRREAAREGFIEALELYRRLDLPTEQADCLDTLGCIARHDRLLDFAEKMHLAAQRLYAGCHHPVDEAICRYNLAITYIHVGRYPEAIEYCDMTANVATTSVDARGVKAYALDALGESSEAAQLRTAYIQQHGLETFHELLAELP